MTRKKNTRYEKKIKEDCVKHLTKSDKSARTVAEELGISAENLCRWSREISEKGVKSFTGKGNARDEEIYRLTKELKNAQEERDILKKAMAIFSKG